MQRRMERTKQFAVRTICLPKSTDTKRSNGKYGKGRADAQGTSLMLWQLFMCMLLCVLLQPPPQ